MRFKNIRAKADRQIRVVKPANVEQQTQDKVEKQVENKVEKQQTKLKLK